MGNTDTQDQPPTGQLQTLFTSTATQTVAATVTETSIIGAGSGSLTLPANTLAAGKTLRFQARGLYSTPALNIGNLLVKIKLGGVTLASGTATALLVSTTNSGWEGTAIITCRSTGVSGTVIIMAGVNYALGNNVAAAGLAINNGTATSTVDTTGTLLYETTVTWSNNTSGNSISSLNCVLEALN